MHYVPEKVREIDSRLGDDTISAPATHVWDAIRGNQAPHTLDEIVDLFITEAERKNRTKKIENLVKSVVAELKKAGFLYEFSGKYLVVLNKV